MVIPAGRRQPALVLSTKPDGDPVAGTEAPEASATRAGRTGVRVLAHPVLAGRSQGGADGLDPDQAIAEDKGVDAVLDPVAAALGAPLQQQDVVLEDGGREIPGRLRDLPKDAGEGLADAVLAAEHAGRGDEHGVIAEVGHDLV